MIAIASKSIGNWVDGSSITITKPSGLAVGDLMVAIIASVIDANNTPSGWAKSDNWGLGRLSLFTKIADSSDVAASNFTFTNSGTSRPMAGILYRVTGAGNSAVYFDGHGTTDSTSDTLATSGTVSVGTIATTQLLFMAFRCDNSSGGVGFSGYRDTGLSLTWTEDFDTAANLDGAYRSLAVASAVASTQGTITKYEADTTLAGLVDLGIAVIPPQQDAAATVSAITADTAIPQPSGGGGTSATVSSVTGNTAVPQPSGSVAAQTIANQTKNTVSVTNQAKS